MANISKIKLPNNSEYNIKDSISYNKVISRGEQLVINGSGMLGDNTNWSSWVFDGSYANSSAGSFTRISPSYVNISTDEYFPVNASEKYKFEFDLISKNNAGTMYAYLSFYDVDKISITASNTMYYAGTLTTLARELKAGDTKVYLTDASAYQTYGTGSHLRALIFWDYKNSFGYQYPPQTYSRNVLMPAWTDDGSIDKTNNIITLTTAYTGVTHPAGTYVSQGCSGGTYKYSGITGQKVPTEWTHYIGYFDGTDYSGLNKGETFPPATAYCKIGFLWDYNSADDQFWLTNISVKEIPKDFAGILPVENGGTGKSSGRDASNYFINALDTGSSIPDDADYYISQFVGGGTTTTTYHRRPMSTLWNYTKGKINSVLGLNATSYGGISTRATADKNGNDITSTYTPLSSGFGKELAYISVSDWNTITGTKCFYATTVANAKPAGTDHVGLQLAYSSSWKYQFAFDYRTDTIYTRACEAGTWHDWYPIYTTAKTIDANTVNGHTVNSDVPSDAKFTDTVTTATTTGSGNAVTAITASNGALTVTKGITFLTSHQDISGKADKSATVSAITWDSTNNKLTKTINGSTTDVVTLATIKTALGSMPASDVYSWAKASTKPSYAFSELTTHPTSISGYGITDAYTKTEVDNKVSAVLRYKGVKAAISNLPTSGNVTGDVWHVTATSGEYAWDGTEWQELGTAISIPANTGSSTTGISIANHSTGSVIGVSSSTTSVYGVSSTTTTASKVTVGSSSTDYGVTAAGSGSASLTFTMDTTDTKKLKITFSHTHTAPTLGSKVPTVSASDVTVPIKNADATTVPIKNSSATTVVTSATHSVTDNGHTHTI